MKIKIIGVGKIKENFFTQAISEYSKRLSRYCKLEITELLDEKTPDKCSETVTDGILKKEGARILSAIGEDEYVIALAIEGRKFTSEGLAQKLDSLMTYGHGQITFIIGGSLGIDSTVKNRADLLLSFSDMTFPHQLMRVILLEQIYRAFRILNNEPYHK